MHTDLWRDLNEPAQALISQSAQLPAEVSAGQGGHQDGVRVILPPLEDDGDSMAADRLLQLFSQGDEMTGLQRGEETNHEQSGGTIRKQRENKEV